MEHFSRIDNQPHRNPGLLNRNAGTNDDDGGDDVEAADGHGAIQLHLGMQAGAWPSDDGKESSPKNSAAFKQTSRSRRTTTPR